LRNSAIQTDFRLLVAPLLREEKRYKILNFKEVQDFLLPRIGRIRDQIEIFAGKASSFFSCVIFVA
jgi:hypothetical protein